MKTMRIKNLFVIVAFLFFILGFENGGFQRAFIEVAQAFSLSNTQTGILVALQFIAIMSAPLIFGNIADKIGKKKVLMFAIPLFAFGCFIAGSATLVGAFAAGVFILGAGYGITECLFSAALSDSKPENAERALSLSQVCFSAGAVLGPIITSSLINIGFSWNIVFIISGISFLVVFPFFLLTVFKKNIEIHTIEKKSFFSLFNGGILIFFALCLFLYLCIENGFVFYIDSFYSKQLSEATLGTYAISFFWIGSIASRLLFGLLKINMMKLLSVLYVLMILLLLLVTMQSNPNAGIIISFCIGFVSGPFFPVLVGGATKQFPNNTGAAASVMMAAAGLGGSFAPFILGVVADAGGFRMALFVLVICAVLGSVSFLMVKKKAMNPMGNEK